MICRLLQYVRNSSNIHNMLVTIAKAQQLAQRIDFAVRIVPGRAIEIIQKE